MLNNSVKKCCICNNEKIGEFITINDNKYHLCCIENLEQENNQLKERVSYLERSNNRREETILDLRSENVDLATKIEKAIEIIEGCNLGIFDYSIEQIGIIKLLKILKESDIK